jgi:hypothetical protein
MIPASGKDLAGQKIFGSVPLGESMANEWCFGDTEACPLTESFNADVLLDVTGTAV